MSSKHTPGPWTVHPQAFSQHVVKADRDHLPVVADVYGSEATARLIAAAPDMLDALEAALDWIGKLDDEISAELLAVIRKATGEKPCKATCCAEPMTPAEHHEERQAFAAKCEGEE